MKKNYQYELFERHNLSDEDINSIFDAKKILKLSVNVAFDDRIDAEVQIRKDEKIKVIFIFDPFVSSKKIEGKLGIITAFRL